MWVPLAWFVSRLTGLTTRQQAAAATGPALAALSMAVCVYVFVAWLGNSIPAPVSLLLAVPVGALLYLAALSLFAPAAARFVRAALGTLIRGDIRALRAMFAGG
jgi:multidrug efflux pump subunit AcrB